MHLRKHRAGSTSHGHVWDEDGQVIEVPDHHGAELLHIPDGGFEAVDPATLPDPEPVLVDDEMVEEPGLEPVLTEPAPVEDAAVDEAPKRRGRPPKLKE